MPSRHVYLYSCGVVGRCEGVSASQGRPTDIGLQLDKTWGTRGTVFISSVSSLRQKGRLVSSYY